MSAGENVSRDMHAIFGGIGSAVALGMVASRAQADARQAHIARCRAAARGAEADVLHAAASQLRIRLEDAAADLATLRDELTERDDEVATLKADLAAVCSLVREIRAGRAA